MTTFLELQTELYARGFDYLGTDAAGIARAKRWLNQAESRIVTEELWPLRLTTAAGAAPLTVTDLGKILTVVDYGNNFRPLIAMTEVELTDIDLNAEGVPLVYWLVNTVVRVWPYRDTSISVRHYKLAAALTADTDVSLIPDRHIDVVVDDAVRRAAKDNSDWETVRAMAESIEQGLGVMRAEMLVAPTHVRRIPVTHEDE